MPFIKRAVALVTFPSLFPINRFYMFGVARKVKIKVHVYVCVGVRAGGRGTSTLSPDIIIVFTKVTEM